VRLLPRRPHLYHYHDTHTLSVDEMTGIQALERIAATLPMRFGQRERREFEYKRHGTITLIGNFHTVTGELIAPTLGPTRKEGDFVRHIKNTVLLDPTAGYIFVLDNLNIHQSAGLVELVAQLNGVEEDLGAKGKRGVLKSMRSRQEFLSDLSPSNPLRVFAQTHLLAEPDRDRVWDRHAKSRPQRQFQVGRGSARQVVVLHRVFQ